MELRMQYATAADGVRIAFGTAGSGPMLVRVPSLPFSHTQREWENGSPFYEELASHWTVVQFDPRGTGLSDREVEDCSLEARLLDIDAVLDKLGLGRVPLHGISWSGPLVVTYAVRHPERVSHVILDDSHARTEDFMNIPQIRALDQLTGEWDTFLEYLAYMIYGLGRDEAAPIVEFMKSCVTPEGAQRIFDTARGDDVTDLLPQVTQPALVIQHRAASMHAEASAREMAALIPDARLVILEGQAADDTERLVHAIADFLGTEHEDHHRPAVVPMSASGVRAILFTDMVGHTEMMDRLGDAAGRDVLREHEDVIRGVLRDHQGEEIKTMGDGFMASFGSVNGAVECAIHLQRAFARRNDSSAEPVVIRVGLTAGEPIEDGGDLFGATVIMASRIANRAGPGEILASDVIRGLWAGKGFLFADRGESELRGFEDRVHLYEVGWQE